MSRNYSDNNEWFDPSAYNRDVDWALIRRFLEDHYQPYKKELLQAFLVSVGFSLTGYAIPKIFTGIQQHVSGRNATMAVAFLGLYLGVVLLQQIFNYVNSRIKAGISTGLDRDVTLKYYSRLLGSTVPEFLRFRRESNVFQRVIDAMSITGQFTNMLISGVMQSVTAVVFLGVIISISPVVGFVLVAGSFVFALHILSHASWLREKRQHTLGINYPLVTKMLDIIEGLLTVKALSASVGVTSDIQEKVENKREAKYDEQVASARVDAISKSLKSLILISAVGVCFALFLQGDLQLSQFFAVYVLTEGYLGPANGIIEQYKELAVLSVNLNNYYEVIDIHQEAPQALPPTDAQTADGRAASDGAASEDGRNQPPTRGTGAGVPAAALTSESVASASVVSVSPASAPPLAGSGATGDGASSNGASPNGASSNDSSSRKDTAFSTPPHLSIVEPAVLFENVNFSYTSEETVLTDVSFRVEAGEHVALIGRSGVGKTTIFRLLLAYLTPDEGRIRVGGRDISRINDKGAYRRQFGIVNQDDYLFNIPLRDNITFGLLRQPSDERIFEMLREVNLLDTVRDLEDGLDTVYDDDSFSGGQKQRLLVARALIRDPKIALLDEPTSSLDFENERLITETIDQLVNQNTTITIAHRLSTVQKADRILVLDDGSVRASGTHDELYAQNNYYRALCDYNSFIA